jgi:hypothetical protein
VKANAAGLAVLRWSTASRDLSVPHLVVTHLMQALPVLGCLLGRIVDRRNPAAARRLPWVAAAPGIATTGRATARAATGQLLEAM